MNNEIAHKKSTIFIIALIVLSTVTIDTLWKFNLEQSVRQSARYNLNNIKSCVNDLLLSNDKGIHTNYRVIDNSEVEKAIRTCGRNSLTTPTGDIFAYDLHTKEFIFDPSLDCFVPDGKYMTIESECRLHLNTIQCKVALNAMNSGYNSNSHLKTTWQFDNGKEYLEWTVLPSVDRGFDGIVRTGNARTHQVVVAQGIQEDELWSRYNFFRVGLYFVGFLSILINLALSVHHNVMRGEREDD